MSTRPSGGEFDFLFPGQSNVKFNFQVYRVKETELPLVQSGHIKTSNINNPPSLIHIWGVWFPEAAYISDTSPTSWTVNSNENKQRVWQCGTTRFADWRNAGFVVVLLPIKLTGDRVHISAVALNMERPEMAWGWDNCRVLAKFGYYWMELQRRVWTHTGTRIKKVF